MKTRKLLLFLGWLLVAKTLRAQVIPEISYQFSVPIGDFKRFVEKPGLLGIGLQFRKYLNDNRISIGGGFCWFYFSDKKGTQTLELPGDDGTYTGYVTSYSNIYGLQAIFQYDLKDRAEKIVPFLQAGLGAAYQNQRQDIGLLGFKYDGFQVLSHVDAGVRYSLPRHAAINISLRYHYLPNGGDAITTSFAGFRIGYSGFRL